MKNGPKYTYTLKREALKPASQIKSDSTFATPGTQFKATEPGTSNQPISETSGDRAINSIKKVVGGAITGAITGAPAAGMAKGPIYMMYGKKAAPMMGGSPLAKYGCSKKYKKSGVKMTGEDKLEATILHDTDKGEQTKYKGRMVTIKGSTVTRGGNVIGHIGKDKKIKEI